MAELKTKKTDASVEAFLNKVEHDQKRKDSFTILEMMQKISKAEAKMWGGSIIGFGDYHYKYASGREGDWFKVGFSPRKASISLYLMGCDISQANHLLQKLGKHKTGKGCLYINKLADIDIKVLEELIKESVKNNSAKDQKS